MNKRTLLRAVIPSIISLVMIALPLSAVFADQIFYFNDELESAYTIDNSQSTSIVNLNGEIYLAQGVLNGSVTSGIVNGVNGNIKSASIDGKIVMPPGTFIEFYITNDNGLHWYQTQRGGTFQFPQPGSQLKWRALIGRTFPSFNPYIESITIGYTIIGTVNGNQNGWQAAASLGDTNTFLCRALSMVGIPCGSSSPVATSTYVSGTYQPHPVTLNFDIFHSSSSTAVNNSSAGNSDLTAAIGNASAPEDLTGQKINLVSVQGSSQVYELLNGQKHLFPSPAIFYDYGYTSDMIQSITQDQLDKYPRADLVKVEGDSKVYYLTEGGLVRLVPDIKKIFDFYGDRTEDVITISRKEFNFYPVNQYVYQEAPLNRDVFQISGNTKRYLTPMAVTRLGIRADQVAPVSQNELNYYKIIAPLVD